MASRSSDRPTFREERSRAPRREGWPPRSPLVLTAPVAADCSGPEAHTPGSLVDHSELSSRKRNRIGHDLSFVTWPIARNRTSLNLAAPRRPLLFPLGCGGPHVGLLQSTLGLDLIRPRFGVESGDTTTDRRSGRSVGGAGIIPGFDFAKRTTRLGLPT
jgi:hypothetical protein